MNSALVCALGYWVVAFVFATTIARFWHRVSRENREGVDSGISPRGMFLLSFFFFPLAAIFFGVVGVVSVLVAAIENPRLGEKLDKLIEWKNND